MTVTLEEAQKSLKELIRQTSEGQKVLITENQKPVAELIAVAATEPVPVFGSCKGMLTIVAEDEDHLNDFASYMK
jgi:prevent-host-death family protein